MELPEANASAPTGATGKFLPGIALALRVRYAAGVKLLKSSAVHSSESICLACGLCCNGAIFSNVTLQPGDNVHALRALGLVSGKKPQRKQSSAPIWRFSQPCSALNGCRCAIYECRPTYCRQFECLLLKDLQEGKLERLEGLRLIRTARARARKVAKLLRALGDSNEDMALTDRVRGLTKNLKPGELDPNMAHLYGRLTLAWHDLTVMISDAFYRPVA